MFDFNASIESATRSFFYDFDDSAAHMVDSSEWEAYTLDMGFEHVFTVTKAAFNLGEGYTLEVGSKILDEFDDEVEWDELVEEDGDELRASFELDGYGEAGVSEATTYTLLKDGEEVDSFQTHDENLLTDALHSLAVSGDDDQEVTVESPIQFLDIAADHRVNFRKLNDGDDGFDVSVRGFLS